MNASLRRLIVGLATIAIVPAVSAQTIVTSNANPVIASPEITEFNTNFNLVGGIEVYWTNSAGSSSGIWGDLGGGIWGVVGDGFSLTGVGSSNTFDNPWTLAGTDLESFGIYGVPGLGVFDIITSPDLTEGSASGFPFTFLGGGGDLWNTTVTFSSPVSLNGEPFQNDLYARMDVVFGDLFDTETTFRQDMDNAPTIVPGNVVPEPASMTLLATGLAGLAAARRRKKQS